MEADGGENAPTALQGVSLPIPAPVAITDDTAVLAGNDTNSAVPCTGSAENPTAPRGGLCAYLKAAVGTSSAAAGGIDTTPFDFTTSSTQGVRWGFVISVQCDSDNTTRCRAYGTFAYTAP